MRVCKNCGRYFSITGRANTGYCNRPFDSRGRTCKEVGAIAQWTLSKKDDDVFKDYRREYKKRFARMKAGTLPSQEFYAWSKKAREKKAACEAGEITVDKFEKITFPQYPDKATRHTGRYTENMVSPANIFEMIVTTQKYGIIWQATPRIARIILKINLAMMNLPPVPKSGKGRFFLWFSIDFCTSLLSPMKKRSSRFRSVFSQPIVFYYVPIFHMDNLIAAAQDKLWIMCNDYNRFTRSSQSIDRLPLSASYD